jgi:hypothetical protein
MHHGYKANSSSHVIAMANVSLDESAASVAASRGGPTSMSESEASMLASTGAEVPHATNATHVT